jgi:hypothetical protein
VRAVIRTVDAVGAMLLSSPAVREARVRSNIRLVISFAIACVGGLAIAGENEAVLKSIDGGLSWEVPSRLPGFYVSALAIDPTNANTVYVGQQVATFSGPDAGKIFKSTDGGEQWREVPIPVPAGAAVTSLAIARIQEHRQRRDVDRCAKRTVGCECDGAGDRSKRARSDLCRY